jgi:hypothetical protein
MLFSIAWMVSHDDTNNEDDDTNDDEDDTNDNNDDTKDQNDDIYDDDDDCNDDTHDDFSDLYGLAGDHSAEEGRGVGVGQLAVLQLLGAFVVHTVGLPGGGDCQDDDHDGDQDDDHDGCSSRLLT